MSKKQYSFHFAVVICVIVVMIAFAVAQKWQASSVTPVPVPTTDTNQPLPVSAAILKTFTDTKNGYSFAYPTELVPYTPDQQDETEPTPVQIDFPDTYNVANSTVHGMGMRIIVTKETEPTCSFVGGQDPGSGSPNYSAVTKEKIGAITFDRAEEQDCGAGQCGHVYQYSVQHGPTCYKLGLVVFQSNPGITSGPNDPAHKAAVAANSAVEAHLLKQFQGIVSTFAFAK